MGYIKKILLTINQQSNEGKTITNINNITYFTAYIIAYST
ncbi:hypothetical protein EJ73_02731 [Hoylesella shahii DSM 15611 = JCM 12083]|uniref:Uncharacterized protein n=1 Tax=Hoylesella shahii DSM 15611 = JCM 12083 TaxID=1122991 RepID=A0A318HUB8_9BACT|nr:hypothetical protein EJ73_02731 [Hoylesella shahii DSM 15611 = JCM 12083]